MATFDAPRLLDALSAPMGDLIRSIGESVASAQRDMDAQTIAFLQQIYTANSGLYYEIQRIGYRPTWYHIPEVEAELQVALTVSGNHEQTNQGGAAAPLSRVRAYVAPVDAAYTSKFNYELSASSKLKFRIVPIPESPAMEQVRVVPAVVGLTVPQARERLEIAAVPHEFPDTAVDTDIVDTQTPEGGALLEPGQTVILTTKAPTP